AKLAHEGPAFVFPRRLLLMLAVPALLMLVGSLGYHFIEGKPYFDSLYFTVITLTTVGYGDIVPETQAGRAFTIFLALGGIFTLFYVATEMIRLVVSGEVHTVLGRRRMEQNLSEMKGHLIVCGFGRMGRLVCKEFASQRLPFVIIERNEQLLESFPF